MSTEVQPSVCPVLPDDIPAVDCPAAATNTRTCSEQDELLDAHGAPGKPFEVQGSYVLDAPPNAVIVVVQPAGTVDVGLDFSKLPEKTVRRQQDAAEVGNTTRTNNVQGEAARREAARLRSTSLKGVRLTFSSLLMVDTLFFVVVLLIVCTSGRANFSFGGSEQIGSTRLTVTWWIDIKGTTLEQAILSLVVNTMGGISVAREKVAVASLFVLLELVSTAIISLQQGLSLFILWRMVIIATTMWFRATLYKVMMLEANSEQQQEMQSLYFNPRQVLAVAAGFFAILTGTADRQAQRPQAGGNPGAPGAAQGQQSRQGGGRGQRLGLQQQQQQIQQQQQQQQQRARAELYRVTRNSDPGASTPGAAAFPNPSLFGPYSAPHPWVAPSLPPNTLSAVRGSSMPGTAGPVPAAANTSSMNPALVPPDASLQLAVAGGQWHAPVLMWQLPGISSAAVPVAGLQGAGAGLRLHPSLAPGPVLPQARLPGHHSHEAMRTIYNPLADMSVHQHTAMTAPPSGFAAVTTSALLTTSLTQHPSSPLVRHPYYPTHLPTLQQASTTVNIAPHSKSAQQPSSTMQLPNSAAALGSLRAATATNSLSVARQGTPQAANGHMTAGHQLSDASTSPAGNVDNSKTIAMLQRWRQELMQQRQVQQRHNVTHDAAQPSQQHQHQQHPATVAAGVTSSFTSSCGSVSGAPRVDSMDQGPHNARSHPTPVPSPALPSAVQLVLAQTPGELQSAIPGRTMHPQTATAATAGTSGSTSASRAVGSNSATSGTSQQSQKRAPGHASSSTAAAIGAQPDATDAVDANPGPRMSGL